jgi:hypothetical protein
MNLDEAKKAISDYFHDRSNGTPRQVIDGLEELRDECDYLIGALRCDVAREEE